MISGIVSHYRIIDKIGSGGMGDIYQAEDIKLKRTVALKFLPQSFSRDQDAKKRLVHEAQAASSLDHPNICTIHEIGETEDGQLFIAMAYYAGETLKEKIARGPIEKNEAIWITRQICEGLERAHKSGIIHRDIKPANIFITDDGIVKILDFGLAKAKGQTQLTKMGSTVGTAGYMSPEQATGSEVDKRTDIWSTGVVFYEMITGHLPFKGDYEQAVIYSIINTEPDLSETSNELEPILRKAFSKSAGERYQNIVELINDLKVLQNDRGSAATHPKATTSFSRLKLRTKIIFAVIFTVVISLIALYYFNTGAKTKDLNTGQISADKTPEKSLAVMYFENIPDPDDKDHTGEMLTNLLITSLSQIKGIEVISRERLLDIQKNLGLVATKNLSPSYAQQVANQANISTMLIGSILQQKPKLAITTRLIDVHSGKIVSSFKVTDFSANQIFNLVDSLAYLLKTSFNVSPASSPKLKPVAEVTTKSPEAYRAYIEGIELFNKIYFTEARAAFEKAIELDSNFAMAYNYLSALTADPQKKWNLFQKAVKLVDKTTERERLQILAQNYMLHSKPVEAAVMLEKLIHRYPHEIRAYMILARVYGSMMLQPQKSIEVLKLGLKLNTSAKFLMNNLAYVLAFNNRKQEALNIVNEYIKLAPAEPNPYDTKAEIYALFMDYDSSRASYKKSFSLIREFSAKGLAADALLRGQYDEAEKYFNISRIDIPYVDIYKGKFHSALKKYKEILASEKDTLSVLSNMIPLYYEMGQYPEMLQASKKVSDKLKNDPSDIFYGRMELAWALIKNGKRDEAYKIMDKLQKISTGGSPNLQVIVDYTYGIISYEEKNYTTAIEKFNKVFSSMVPNHWPSIFFAASLLKNGNTSSAVELFKRIIYYPFNVFGFGPLPGDFEYWPIPEVKTHYWLGIAYEQAGKTEEALKEYEKFINIWKDADFKSPDLNDAKSRAIRLRKLLTD